MYIKFKAGDILVYILILVLIAGSYIGLYYMKSSATGLKLIIEVDGKVKGEYNLKDLSEDDEILVDAGSGRQNMVRIEDGNVFISEANCPDQICVKSGRIKNPGQTIICLPHKVVVRISGREAENNDLDDIAS